MAAGPPAALFTAQMPVAILDEEVEVHIAEEALNETNEEVGVEDVMSAGLTPAPRVSRA